MTYQKVTGPLMAHSVSYDGQDAYNDMFVTEKLNESKLGRIADRSDLLDEEEDMKTVVRRLTPMECERLQGFKDDWTLIGGQEEDGEYYYTDTNGKRRKVTDSARYKALGNSIALPFWCWLARRIAAQYERDITMGSLFDGIGGFPYAFEKAGAKAVWASEIEEFPIAVTKEHFPEEES